MISQLAKAINIWKESAEFKRVTQGSISGIYLENRLELAFIAGWEGSEEYLLPVILECAETLDWMLKDMKYKHRIEKDIPDELEDCQVEYSPELTKAIELQNKLKTIIGE